MAQILVMYFILAGSYCASFAMAAGPGSYSAQAPMVRKMGMFDYAPTLSPVSNERLETEESVSVLEEKFLIRKHHHGDRSIVGGCVILGGFVITFVAAIFCYLEATARHRKPEVASSEVANVSS